MTHSLDPLLRPKSVAVIGASDNPARIGGRPIFSMLEGGFKGRLYPVNPNRETIQGLKSYPSISSVPEEVDSVVISVPEKIALDVVRECAAAGVKSVVMFTSGFAEIGAQGEQIRILENTDQVHNLVVCTLCSCYPWPILGLPPVWYKSAPYRSRAVADPRGVLAQFGTNIPENVEIRVWDSTSEMRFLVLPQRPEGTEDWPEEKLISLVSRNSMIGVEKVNLQTEELIHE